MDSIANFNKFHSIIIPNQIKIRIKFDLKIRSQKKKNKQNLI